MSNPSFNSQDGQFGYVKATEKGEWQKIRLSDGQCVGTLKLESPKEKWNGLGKPPKVHSPSYMQGHVLPQQQAKDWVQQLADQCQTPLIRDGYEGLNWHSHDGIEIIWQFDGKAFYAAGYGKMIPSNYDLVLDLADQLRWIKQVKDHGLVLRNGPNNYMALNKFALSPKGNPIDAAYTVKADPANVVAFDWKDGKALKVGTDFWEELWQLCPGEPEKPGTILVGCLGAHGRTGTCLAALMMASNDPLIQSPLEAVLTVRANHCERAIESRTQFDYLNALAEAWKMPTNALKAQRVAEGKSKEFLEALRREAPQGKGKVKNG